MSDTMCRLLLHAHLAATLYMTGLIWFVQVVHYPLFALVSNRDFAAYERRHTSLTTWVVAPPMLTEAVTGLLLLLLPHPAVSPRWLWVGLGLLAIIWLSTACLQIPCHRELSSGFNRATHLRLVRTNWLRTVAWSLRSLVVLSLVWTTVW